jgi:hypothetical protein
MTPTSPSEEPTEFCLVKDDSGHSYVCPLDRRGEARRRLEELDQFWSHGGECFKDGAIPPEEPEFLTKIGGPHRLIFTGWREG